MAPSLQALRRRQDDQLTTQLKETITRLEQSLQQEGNQNEYITERLADLELALDDIGWHRLDLESQWEFTRDGIDRLIALSRLASLKNPLIRRAVHLKADYVFGQGVEISARDDDINEQVIQPFLDDPANANVLFSDVALPQKDRTLTTDGSVVLVLFPNRITGHVSVRGISIDEIRDIVTNPDDRAEVWFYKRCWTERLFSLDGPSAGFRTAVREAWYPDWRYQPAQRPESIDRVQVRWDSPIYHAKVGGLDGMRFGLPETYAALDWAKAYKLFLEDWSTIVRSLSRFAWQMTVKRRPGDAARKLNTATSPSQPRETNPSPTAGAMLTVNEGNDLKALPKTDAVIASEDGVWLAKMVGAAMGVPYTILMGDPDMGNLATAKTLDRPTELSMIGRQRLWAEVLRDLCSYAIDWAIRAPGGPIRGTTEVGPDGRVRYVVDDSDTVDSNGQTQTVTGADRRTVDVVFPPILEDDVNQRVQAIVAAADTELPPPELVLRLLLTALGVDDIDEIVAALPERLEQRLGKMGQVAVDRWRQGLDPTDVMDPPPPSPTQQPAPPGPQQPPPAP